jgi:hypothetical protein
MAELIYILISIVWFGPPGVTGCYSRLSHNVTEPPCWGHLLIRYFFNYTSFGHDLRTTNNKRRQTTTNNDGNSMKQPQWSFKQRSNAKQLNSWKACNLGNTSIAKPWPCSSGWGLQHTAVAILGLTYTNIASTVYVYIWNTHINILYICTYI